MVLVYISMSLQVSHSWKELLLTNSLISLGNAVPVDPQHIHRTTQQLGIAMQSASGLIGTPIDVEAIEDDIQLLSSKRMFPAGTHHQLRRSPVTVVIDDDLELNLRHSDITTLESVPALSANCHNREKNSTNRKIISSDLCLNFEDHDGMGKNVRKSSHPKPSKAPMLPLPPKELTFTCPVCLNPLVEPSSTTCGHIFCLPCIKESVEKHKKCPICQKELTANNFHRVNFPTATDD